MDNLVSRLQTHLQNIGRNVPGCWKHIDELRAQRGRNVPDWPEWCFVPISATLAVVNHAIPNRADSAQVFAPAILAGLASWRVTKGVYVFDEAILDSLWETSIEKIPAEFFFRLPEWCVYVQTPGKMFDGKPLRGFFVHLEHDTNTNRPELRFLLDLEKSDVALIPLVIHLDRPTLDEAVEAVLEEGIKQATRNGIPAAKAREMMGGVGEQRSILPSLLSLTLYICSQNAEIRSPLGNQDFPSRPKPAKTKQGERFFEATRIRQWECGWRSGAALRRALSETRAEGGSGSGYNSPRPHIRRAHYHHFWTGPANNRALVLKWVHPVLVNARAEEELPTVFHPIGENE